MGYMRHHAIIVTTSKDEQAHALWLVCRKAYIDAGGNPGAVTPLTPPLMNGYCSFAILPDGSKEGWLESDNADAARKAVKKILNDRMSLFCKWIEVIVGEDGQDPRITDSDRHPLEN